MLSYEAARDRVREALPAARLIGIDGMPLSGKSTLAERLAADLNLPCFGLDEFFDAPSMTVGYPFDYFRYDQFEAALIAFRAGEPVTYHPFDWPGMRVSDEVLTVAPGQTLIVEGCSILQPRFRGLFDLTFYVQGDYETRKTAQHKRDGDGLAQMWERSVWPSIELYLATDPAGAADCVVAGRGL